ncbi:MAG: CPBP family intramembrane metalloprotease [Clostridia bacterium]|nr:CPBP family intramembrane metalloprotease [Clostridia bacterium]
MYNQPPVGGPYKPPYGHSYWPIPPIPETPVQRETKQLRKDGNFIGTMMLAMEAGTQFAFTAVAIVLCVMGVLDFRQLGTSTLGLSNTNFLLLYGLVYILAMGGTAVLVALCFQRFRFPTLCKRPLHTETAFLGVLGAMGVCMLANVFASYIVTFFSRFGIESPKTPDLLAPTITSFLLNLLVVAVLPALLEELVFRYYVLRTLRPYGDGLAVLLSSLLFGLMHGNVAQIPFAFLVGIALGWLYVATDRIWLSIVVHFANNALSLTLDYLGNHLQPSEQPLFFNWVVLAIGFVGLVALVALYIRRGELFRRRPCASLLRPVSRFFTLLRAPVLLTAVLVFLLLTVVGIVS